MVRGSVISPLPPWDGSAREDNAVAMRRGSSGPQAAAPKLAIVPNKRRRRACDSYDWVHAWTL